METTIENVFEELLLIKDNEEVLERNSSYVNNSKNPIDNTTKQIAFRKIADPFFKTEISKQLYTSIFDFIISKIDEEDEFYYQGLFEEENEDEDEEDAKEAFRKLNVKDLLKDNFHHRFKKKLKKFSRPRSLKDVFKRKGFDKNTIKKNIKKEIKKEIKRLGKAVKQRVLNAINRFKKRLRIFFKKTIRVFKSLMSKTFSNIKSIFKNFGNLKESALKKGGKDKFSLLKNTINKMSKFFKSFIDFFKKGLKKIPAIFKNIFMSLIKHLRAPMQFIGKILNFLFKKVLWGFFKLIIKLLPKLAMAISSAAAGAVTFGSTWVITAVNIAWIAYDVGSFAYDIGPFLAAIPQNLDKFEKITTEGAMNFSNEMKNKSDYFESVKGTFEKLDAFEALADADNKTIKNFLLNNKKFKNKNYKLKAINLIEDSKDLDSLTLENEITDLMEEIQEDVILDINIGDYEDSIEKNMAKQKKYKSKEIAVDTMREALMFKDDVFTILVSSFDWLIKELDNMKNILSFENILNYNKALSNLFNIGFTTFNITNTKEEYENYSGIADVDKDKSISGDLKIELKKTPLTDVLTDTVKNNFKARKEKETEKLKMLIELLEVAKSK